MTSARQPSRNPLYYVAAAGILLLLLYAVVTADQQWRRDSQVIVTAGQQQHIVDAFRNTWQRDPSEAEMQELLARYTRQEMAWREATRLGLGRDDPDIRRRLQQQLESMAAAEVRNAVPARHELQAFLEDHADEFQVDPQLTFRQIFFDNNGNTIGADASARFMLGRLQNQDMPEDIAELGDPSPLPADLENVHSSDISPLFGRDFAAALATAPVREWLGPIQSKFGLHIVYIDSRTAGRIPELGEIEGDVEAKWRQAKRSQAVEEMYRRLAETYGVSIEEK